MVPVFAEIQWSLMNQPSIHTAKPHNPVGPMDFLNHRFDVSTFVLRSAGSSFNNLAVFAEVLQYMLQKEALDPTGRLHFSFSVDSVQFLKRRAHTHKLCRKRSQTSWVQNWENVVSLTDICIYDWLCFWRLWESRAMFENKWKSLWKGKSNSKL